MSLRPPTRILVLLAAAATTVAAAAQTSTPSTDVPVAVQPATPRASKPRLPKPQKNDAPAYNANVIVLDAAHGGADSGARLGSGSLEKDATVAFAAQLKPRLEAQGFTVILTHPDAAADLTADARIELSNRSHAVACLLLHASNGGHGVHLYTSALMPVRPVLASDEYAPIVPWDTVQASAVPQSLRLVNDLASALAAARIPLVVGQSSPRPLDSLSCPAVAVELAPLESASAADAAYQARIAGSLTQALVAWRTQAVALSNAAAAAKAIATPTPAPDQKKPKPKSSPKPASRPATPTPAPEGAL